MQLPSNHLRSTKTLHLRIGGQTVGEKGHTPFRFGGASSRRGLGVSTCAPTSRGVLWLPQELAESSGKQAARPTCSAIFSLATASYRSAVPPQRSRPASATSSSSEVRFP